MISKGIVKKGLNYLSCFIIVLSVVTLTKVLSCMLPDQKIQENIRKSSSLILEEGRYPHHFINNPELSYLYASFRIDTVTDYSILTTVFEESNSEPLKQAFLNKSFIGTDPEEVTDFFQSEIGGKTERVQYWMGITVLLRLAYTFLDMAALRGLMIAIFAVLCYSVLIMLYKKFGSGVAFSFIVSNIMINSWVIQFSPGFIITFLLAYLFMIYVGYYYKPYINDYRMMLVFGMLTAFFDWLSTPLVTFGLPMVVILLCINKEKVDVLKTTKIFICNGIAWVFGWIGMIVSKWILGGIVLDKDIWSIGVKRILAGTSARLEGSPDSFIGLAKLAVQSNFEALYPFSSQFKKSDFVFIIILFIVVCAIVAMFHKKWSKLANVPFFWILACCPYAWYVLLKGHESIHFWFTYRIQSITIFSLLVSFFVSIDKEKIKSNYLNLRKRLKKGFCLPR